MFSVESETPVKSQENRRVSFFTLRVSFIQAWLSIGPK